jgi:hypothetical protein
MSLDPRVKPIHTQPEAHASKRRSLLELRPEPSNGEVPMEASSSSLPSRTRSRDRLVSKSNRGIEAANEHS